jgi:ADP-heptose:LPS heptosyltransferase
MIIVAVETKILVVQIGKLGDMILTTPLFQELKSLFPESEISVLASPGNSVIPENLSVVDFTYKYDKKLLPTIKLVKSLRSKSFDLWIDAKDEYSSTSKLLKSLSNPKKSFGFNFDKNVFDVNLRGCTVGEHRVDINLSPVNYLSGEKKSRTVKPFINIPEQDKLNVRQRLEKVTGKKILFNISAGIETREWSTDNWITVTKNIQNDTNIILSGLKKDYERINLIIEKSGRDKIYFIETKTIFEFAQLIKECDLIVTPDTSAVHLASCFNTPIVCLFNSVEWNRIRFSPLSQKQVVVVSDDENSINSITPEEVIKAINSIS